YVLDTPLQERPPDGRHGLRPRAEEEVEDGDVVARQVEDDADVAAHGPEVRADGVHVVDPPERAAVDGALEVQRARVVEEDVADHQDPSPLPGGCAQGARLGGAEGKRLLAKDVL